MGDLRLANDWLALTILPQFGGGLARFDWLAGDVALPLMRPYDYDGVNAPRTNELACFGLLPWSNRLAGGFSFEGVDYPIAPNRVGDQYPIHGEGWLLPWQVAEQSATELLLTLDHKAGSPFQYEARMRYALDDARFTLTLELRNTGAATLPYGLGVHPFFPRSAGVTLRAPMRELWLSGADKLPAQAVSVPPAWDFAQPRTLPSGGLDHVFEGWSGRADIAWPETGLSLTMEADTGYAIIYIPEGRDFFCVEPVDHLINAHNAPGGPERHGLTLLAPGATLRRTFTFTVDQQRP